MSPYFHFFRYQILPIDRYHQFNQDMFVGNIQTVEDLITQKNDIFFNVLNEINLFSSSKFETRSKEVFKKDDFILYKVIVLRTLHIGTEDFSEADIEAWPAVFVAIWNHPDKQIIAIQKKQSAFGNTKTLSNLIVNNVNQHLDHYGLISRHEPIFDVNKFWDILDQYQGQIEKVEFEFVTPNMAAISNSLTDTLKDYAKLTNSLDNVLALKSSSEGTLKINKDDETTKGLVDYSGLGGGNIGIKVKNIRNKINTSKSITEFDIGEMIIEGNSKQIAEVIKELMSSVKQ